MSYTCIPQHDNDEDGLSDKRHISDIRDDLIPNTTQYRVTISIVSHIASPITASNFRSRRSDNLLLICRVSECHLIHSSQSACHDLLLESRFPGISIGRAWKPSVHGGSVLRLSYSSLPFLNPQFLFFDDEEDLGRMDISFALEACP